ncbi:MAG: DegT/DnrJ/EryC1/StrS family aminotransferase [Desulfurococcales archaeon]|nr:DegT/DnrJ/EryC1/StrS family aminotransferase [Desulfurococcales archaeon]
MIKVNSPYVGEEELEAVAEVLRSGYLAYGPKAREFEREFSEYLGVKHVKTVINGTIALYAALKALGVGEGDEVIVPDFSFFATASTVVLAGGKPVFADIDLETYTISPQDILTKITDRTKGIIVVHLYGHPADMDPIKEIASERSIFILEDCAQAHGAEYKGVKVGSIGEAGAFSFYATKNLTMGEGGAVATNSDEIADAVDLLRNHGQRGRYWHVDIGWNFRLTNIQAAIGLVQLRKLDSMNNRRREIAEAYRDGLGSIEGLRLPEEKPWGKHVYHQYTVWVEDESVRDKLREFLESRGIQVGIHYPTPLHEQPALRIFAGGGCCPNASEASKHVLSLPMHPGLRDEDVEEVVSAVREFFKG